MINFFIYICILQFILKLSNCFFFNYVFYFYIFSVYPCYCIMIKIMIKMSGDNRSMIDYLMARKTDRCLVKDVKVISSEEGVPQHRMVISRLVLPIKTKKKKIVKFVPRPRVWKFRIHS